MLIAEIKWNDPLHLKLSLLTQMQP